MPWKNVQMSVASRFFCMYSFEDSMKSKNLRNWESISAETVLIEYCLSNYYNHYYYYHHLQFTCISHKAECLIRYDL